MKNPSFNAWVAWIGAVIGAVSVGCAFAFTTFETKDHVKELKEDIVQRLVRIENKQDQLITIKKEK